MIYDESICFTRTYNAVLGQIPNKNIAVEFLKKVEGIIKTIRATYITECNNYTIISTICIYFLWYDNYTAY